jgi:hypothetical protein
VTCDFICEGGVYELPVNAAAPRGLACQSEVVGGDLTVRMSVCVQDAVADVDAVAACHAHYQQNSVAVVNSWLGQLVSNPAGDLACSAQRPSRFLRTPNCRITTGGGVMGPFCPYGVDMAGRN